MKKRRPGLILGLVWLALVLVLGEGGLRALSWANRRWLIFPRLQTAVHDSLLSPSVLAQMQKASARRVYRNTPNYTNGSTIHINAHGFRGPAISLAPRARRVICLGDSCTFGWGVADAETYPALLEKRLRARGAQVINAGVPGYSSWQGLLWCREQLFDLEPEVLVVYLGWNDIFEAEPEVGRQRSPSGKRAAYWLGRSVLITRLRLTWHAASRRGKSEAGIYRQFEPRFYKTQISALLKEAAARRVQVVLLALPTSYRPGLPDPGSWAAKDPAKFEILYDRYNRALRQLASDHKVPLIDLAALMNGRAELFVDFCHPSAAGNAAIAEALERTIAPLL